MRRNTLWVMAIASAFAVANLYYNQPLLAAIAQSLHTSVQQVGLIPTLTQVGYTSGCCFGDSKRRTALHPL